MSLVPPGTAPFFDISLYTSVQGRFYCRLRVLLNQTPLSSVAVTSAALYDHGKPPRYTEPNHLLIVVGRIALALGREVSEVTKVALKGC